MKPNLNKLYYSHPDLQISCQCGSNELESEYFIDILYVVQFFPQISQQCCFFIKALSLKPEIQLTRKE